jgi:hypothetical protein
MRTIFKVGSWRWPCRAPVTVRSEWRIFPRGPLAWPRLDGRDFSRVRAVAWMRGAAVPVGHASPVPAFELAWYLAALYEVVVLARVHLVAAGNAQCFESDPHGRPNPMDLPPVETLGPALSTAWASLPRPNQVTGVGRRAATPASRAGTAQELRAVAIPVSSNARSVSIFHQRAGPRHPGTLFVLLAIPERAIGAAGGCTIGVTESTSSVGDRAMSFSAHANPVGPLAGDGSLACGQPPTR